jgi:Flp pilus assembly protein TadG
MSHARTSNPTTRTPRSSRARQRGQELAELGICITILAFLTMGIIEFGRIFMIGNMITSATRDAGRVAATTSNRAGCAPNAGPLQTLVMGQLANVGITSGVSVGAANGVVGGIKTVTVTTTVTVPYLFNLPGVGSSIAVSRQATFRDEVCT